LTFPKILNSVFDMSFTQKFLQETALESEIKEILKQFQENKFDKKEAQKKINSLILNTQVPENLESEAIDFASNKFSSNSNPLLLVVLNLQYDTFKGKLAVGRITSGKISKGMNIIGIQETGQISGKVSDLLIFDGLSVTETDSAGAGEIVMIAGLEKIAIGDTITTPEYAIALPRVVIDQPTIRMTFGVNTSPFSGREGKSTTSRQIWDRLQKELETNVSLQVERDGLSGDKFVVSGRGELHLSVLIEAMRRENFELEVSKPEVIFLEKNKQKLEPFEMVEIDVPQEFQGSVMQELGKRNADIKEFSPNEAGTEYHFVAKMPTRTLIGLKSYLLTATKGTVIMHNLFEGYEPMVTVTLKNDHGSLISTDSGITTGYSLDNAQQRGILFIGPAVEVYAGMVIGQASKDQDLELNPCKEKKLSNMRSKSSDDGVVLTPAKQMTLENCLEYIGDDELVEITPLSLRIRKKYLDPNDRKRGKK
jgi:GTP-binding protein